MQSINHNCILIPSYDKHRTYVDKFLFSIQEKTPNNIDIYIIVGTADEADFYYMTTKYKNVKIIIFTRILELIENVVKNDDILLHMYGKTIYQSLKKFYGLYYLFFMCNYDNIIIFDSESFIIRNVDINQMINDYVVNPFILYSSIPHYNDKLKTDVEIYAQITNDKNDISMWFLEYYLWIYEKRIFTNFVQSFILLFGKTFYTFIENCYGTVFVEVIYQTHIYKTNDVYGYKFIEFVNFMASKHPADLSESMSLINMNIPNKPIEDARIYIEQNLEKVFAHNIYDELQLQLYKTNDSQKSLEFVKRHETITMCVSEYSDIIFNYFNPEYSKNFIYNWRFLLQNAIGIESCGESALVDTPSEETTTGLKSRRCASHDKMALYRVSKKSNDELPFYWVGYEMTIPTNICVKFTFDLFFMELGTIESQHFIAFKQHYPLQLHYIPLSVHLLHIWTHYEFFVNTSHTKEEKYDAYLIIFDNSPQCDILIRNFTFTVCPGQQRCPNSLRNLGCEKNEK